QAFRDLGARRLIITHWGTFRLGDEPVWFPPVQIQEELEKQGLSGCYVPLNHGETFFVPKRGD
ncbi:MAG TPA: MBL fold metallo-hydrolase, partial [Deltaproteobacteria bacterium]|nr:MBL fold metallo-hydrolase [Deltaproteobacteria bacterium]